MFLKANEKARARLDELVTAFENGKIGEIVKISTIPTLDVPCARWSFRNRILCALVGTADARGHNQWKETNRWPMKGSRAFYILVPCHRTVIEKDEENGEETKAKVLMGFKAAPVFRYEDTEGEPLPEYQVLEPPELPPLYEVAERFNLRVKYSSFFGKRYGATDGETRINLHSHDFVVFWHELAHCAHAKVIKERGGKGLKGGQHPNQEAVAELAATAIAGIYGYDYSGNCWRYIKRYAKGGKALQLCLSVLSDTGKVLDLIFGEALNERRADEGLNLAA